MSPTVASSTSDGSKNLETLPCAPLQLSDICLGSVVLHHRVPSSFIFYSLVIHQILFIPFTVVVGFNKEKSSTELYDQFRKVSVAEKVYK